MPTEEQEFSLKVFNAVVDAQVRLLTAQAEYNYWMMETLVRYADFVEKADKIKRARQAYRRFQRALVKANKELRKANTRRSHIVKAIRGVELIAQGQSLSPVLVRHAWNGVRYFRNNPPLGVSSEMAKLLLTSQHRRGEYYSKNADPTHVCSDVDESVETALQLINYLSRRKYMPKVGTPPYKLYAKLTAILAKAGAEELKAAEQRATAVQENLEKLLKTDIKNIPLDAKPE